MAKYILDEVTDIMVRDDVQNIHMRSNKPDGPVVLFVHGGPGVCDRSWVMPDQSKYLADHCVMVCWDQRMAGKSYKKEHAGEEMTLDQQVEDLHAMVLWLCRKFEKKKIYLVGHSWGSILSCLYLPKYPDEIAAYVGMGQFVNGPLNEKMSFDFLMDYAEARGYKKAVRELLEVGPPVDGEYKGGLDGLMVQRNYMTKFGGGAWKEKENIFKSVLVPFFKSGEYNPATDLYKYYQGTFYGLRTLGPKVLKLRFDETVKKLDVPVLLFQGDHDRNTPTELARKWFDELEAPYKEYVPFHESAHSPIKEEPELWGTTLVEKLFTDPKF